MSNVLDFHENYKPLVRFGKEIPGEESQTWNLKETILAGKSQRRKRRRNPGKSVTEIREEQILRETSHRKCR